MDGKFPFKLMKVMTVQQVAELSGVSRRRVQKLCQEGRFDAAKVGGAWLIMEPSVLSWLRSDRKAGRPPKDSKPERGEQLPLDIESE